MAKAKKKERVLIFIDEPNLMGMQNVLEYSFDYTKLRDVLVGNRECAGLRYYTRQGTDPKATGFLRHLRHIGYEILDSEIEDVDPLIVNDIRKMCNNADIIVLVSGDGGYYQTLFEAFQNGKKVEIFCPSEMCASELNGVGTIILPEDMRDMLIDEFKTRKRQQLAVQNSETRLPGAEIVGMLTALGCKVTVEKRKEANELVIRVQLQ